MNCVPEARVNHLKLKDLLPGMRLVAEHTISHGILRAVCIQEGEIVTVADDGSGPYVPCNLGKHRMAGVTVGEETGVLPDFTRWVQ